MAYDYTGYGTSTGKPSVSASLADIDAVYRCLVNDYNVAPSSIVLYGQSVGSGPTVSQPAASHPHPATRSAIALQLCMHTETSKACQQP
jgi:hypothetical protein